MANRPLMVRAVRTIVMQMLIISLIKALEGGQEGRRGGVDTDRTACTYPY